MTFATYRERITWAQEGELGAERSHKERMP